MSEGFLFTSESVTEGHPDKVADQISDAVVDAALAADPQSRVAVETLLTTGLVVLAGEISTAAALDFAGIARETICEIGYDNGECGFDGRAVGVLVALDRQSPDIARGVAESYDARAGSSDPLDSHGAGDQGMMFGYATNETPELMPMPIVLAHKLARRLAEVRRNGLLPFLRPDGKTQVTVRYDEAGRPAAVAKVLISTQHEDGVEAKLPDALWEQVVTPVLPPDLYDPVSLRRQFYVNPTGRFVIGGPVGDTGLTGRKIIVDTYGGFARHGGGAFSGKDPTKVDRSACYAARHVAKNIVAAGLADRAEVQVAYAIGVARPLSLLIETFGTEKVPRQRIADLVREHFDLRPAALLQALDLRRPIYKPTAAYGHFGRDEPTFTWERTEVAALLRAEAGLGRDNARLPERTVLRGPACGLAQVSGGLVWGPRHCPGAPLVEISASAGSIARLPGCPPNERVPHVLAAVTRSPGQMAIEDVAEPGPARAGNVILAPEAVGICGSDFHLYSGDVGALSGVADFYPRIQGHEVSAVVADPGDAAAVTAGDRVAVWPLVACGGCYPCRAGRPNACAQLRLVGVHLDGGLAGRLEVPAANVFPVGEQVQPDCAAFVEPASVAVHALSRARPAPGEQVVIFGAGPIGLATALAAASAGARVLSVDPVPARRDLARRLGAELTAPPAAAGLREQVCDWTGGEGPPLVLETSGEPGVLPQAIEMVSAAGRVVVVGMSSGTAAVRPGAFPEKEIDVIGSSCATAEDFRRAIRLISAHTASLAGLFTHHFPLARTIEAFEFAMSRPPDAIKVVVTVELRSRTLEWGHMRRHIDISRARRAVALAGAAALTAGAAAACSSASPSSSPSTPAGTSTGTPSTAAVSTSQCGTKPGVVATGTPIPLGTIVTNQPGTSFTDISNMANAYFTCVNDNGGINGHPIKYYIETEQTIPTQIAAEAKQLVDTDHVVGIVGNTSIIECAVDSSYWAKLGYYVIGSGIASQCWATPNNVTVNMGPRYSSDGAVQYAISQHVSKIVFDQSNVPGTGYIAAGPNALAKAAGVPITDLTETVPISDADSVAIKEVDDAGPNGAVVLNFTPPEALVILQAAQKLGLEDRVKLWGCSTPCNTDFLAQSLGPKWNHKLFVNAELAPPDSTDTPTMNLYKAILSQYGKAVSGGIGSFSQMGFIEAEIAVHALETIKGAYTVASVNAAFRAVSDFNTGMNCQLWTYGNYPMHIANNMDYTVTPDNGKMVQVQGCTLISSVDPQIAAYRAAAGTAAVAPVKP